MAVEGLFQFPTFNPNQEWSIYPWVFAGDCETCETPVWATLNFQMNPGEQPDGGEIEGVCPRCQRPLPLSNTFQNFWPGA